MNSVSAGSRSRDGLDEVGAVDVGHEAEGAAPVGEVLQRLVGHDGTEVGATDADVHDVDDRLAGVTLPLAAADPLGERRHPVEHGVHLGDHVDAVDDQRRVLGHPEGHVEHGAVLGDVDVVAAEHGIDPPAQPAGLGQGQEEADRLVGDAVLRVVEVQPGPFGDEALAPVRVLGEEVPQVAILQLLVVRPQRRPLRPLASHGSCSPPAGSSSRRSARTMWSASAGPQEPLA